MTTGHNNVVYNCFSSYLTVIKSVLQDLKNTNF